MLEKFTKIVSFFQNPISHYMLNNTNSEDTIPIKYNIETKTTIDISIETIKNKNNEFIQISKNTEYERNLFLYEIGFTKLKRVREFINTMNKIGNIEEFNNIEKKYSKFNLEFLNLEMLNIIKKEYHLEMVSNDKFDGFIPDVTIDNLKSNYNILENYGYIYNLYRKYYQSDEFKLYNDNYIIRENLKKFKDNNNEAYISSYFYKITRKVLFICYNKNKGIILLEVEPNYFLVLCDWSDESGECMQKLNFKNFIKTQE